MCLKTPKMPDAKPPAPPPPPPEESAAQVQEAPATKDNTSKKLTMRNKLRIDRADTGKASFRI